jgi:hypothetical protein
MNSDSDVLIKDWFRRVRESQRVHYECGVRYSRLNYWLGIPTIILTTLVGTAVFASWEQADGGQYRVLLGLVSIAAGVLASLQTFLGFSHRADRHRATGAGYGAVRRSLELLKTFPPADVTDLQRQVENIKASMDKLAETGPEVPTRIKAKIDRELKSRDHKRIFHLPGDAIGEPPEAALRPGSR